MITKYILNTQRIAPDGREFNRVRYFDREHDAYLALTNYIVNHRLGDLSPQSDWGEIRAIRDGHRFRMTLRRHVTGDDGSVTISMVEFRPAFVVEDSNCSAL